MILPLQLQYIFSLLRFLVKYKLNSETDSVNTRQNSSLYQLLSNKTTYHKWNYYFDIKIFNNLPSDIKKKNLSHNVKQFVFASGDFLCLKAFYTLDECFNSTKV
jgi:hypothetical protein